ncbi:MAG: copper homeostasis periplasmic binding protein CopC [Sphingobium sp.]|nr:copper homeostasis periplasmic binding protein CopC [Sphingobium sp.]
MRAASILIASTLLAAAPLAAHPKLVSTTPAAKTTVKPTNKIELHFNEKLVAQFSGGDVTMSAMPGMADMPMTAKSSLGADGKTLVLTLAAPLPEGGYTVAWHAVAADTHRINGSFAFTVK